MEFNTQSKILNWLEINFVFSELLEDAVEEMSEDLALPIAIVLIVGFLGNKSFESDQPFFHIYFIYILSYFMHGNCNLVLRHPRLHCHRCHSPGLKILISHPRKMDNA